MLLCYMPGTLPRACVLAHQGVQASSRPTFRCVPAGQTLQVVESASYSYPADQIGAGDPQHRRGYLHEYKEGAATTSRPGAATSAGGQAAELRRAPSVQAVSIQGTMQ